MKKLLFSLLIIEIINIQFIFSNSFATIPFSYINKKTGNSKPSATTPKDYFESLFTYPVYTTIKINNKNINFHITLDRYATYISEKTFNEIENNKNDEEKLYSLDYIGINRAKFKNNNFQFLFNNTKNINFNNYSFFVTTKIDNISDYLINKHGYATENEEIGFKIVKGNKYDIVNIEPYDPYSDINSFSLKNNNIYKQNFKESYVLRNDGYNIEDKTNLINQLKMRDLISSYDFSIKIDENEEKGEIIIGGSPHEIDKKHYNEKYFIYDTVSVNYYYYQWHYDFKDIIYDGEKLGWGKNIEISLNFGFILSTYNYKEYLEKKFFNNITYSEYCKGEKIGEYFVKYCQEKVIKYFKPMQFCLSNTYMDINQTNYIEFTYKDLFVKAPGDNDLYYFQIIFVDNSYKWIFGRPLFKKYRTVFNQDKKIIGFYTETGDYKSEDNNNNSGEKNENNTISLSWILVFILIFILCNLILVGIIFYNKYKGSRKKKANELDDDNFDYTSTPEVTKDKNQNSSLIN